MLLLIGRYHISNSHIPRSFAIECAVSTQLSPERISIYHLPPRSPSISQPLPSLVHIERLRKRQSSRRLGRAYLAVGLDGVALRVDAHARHEVVVAHVALADVAAPADGLDAAAQAVRGDGARGDGRGGDEEDAGRGDERGEHGAGDDGLDGGDGGVGVALVGGQFGIRCGWKGDIPSERTRCDRS